ncbi:MAG: bifunctional diaminohydroxyphosphoribosylaminopyrimidine deaminase/5-amino-6-(5-phosphoribosylamino)uracil reductase RibD [Planctomycetota bacterium]|nr:bifunctional diaminohydroxyphosphoribosylaminopyrimidine deaminase/5-amino-6-(5-phosphoribosylamino)uracil reductase RibD [Planctomycetota bacterium]
MHDAFMKEALRLAALGKGNVEPNPMVGSVVVAGNEIVGRGHHEFFGGPHAEVNAIRDAGPRAHDATLYVNLEPCAHFGKTPPCVDAIIEAGMKKVVVAMRDPNPVVNGKGIHKLRTAGIEVVEDVLGEESKKLNRAFLKLQKTGFPYVVAKWAMSADGRIATASGESRWITSDEARTRARALRAEARAVVVGIGTVLADDPLLTLRDVPGQQPARVIVDSRARLPVESKIVQTARKVETYVAVAPCAAQADIAKLCELGCKVLEIEEETSATCGIGPESDSPERRLQELNEKRKADEVRPAGTGTNGNEPSSPGTTVVSANSAATTTNRFGRVCIRKLFLKLAELGMLRILVEGGGELLGSIFDARLADEVVIFMAPTIFGGKDAPGPISGEGVSQLVSALKLSDLSIERVGVDLIMRGLLP